MVEGARAQRVEGRQGIVEVGDGRQLAVDESDGVGVADVDRPAVPRAAAQGAVENIPERARVVQRPDEAHGHCHPGLLETAAQPLEGAQADLGAQDERL